MKFHHIGYLVNNFNSAIKDFKKCNYKKKKSIITDNNLKVQIQFLVNGNNIIELVKPHKKNIGLPGSLNKGIKKARGQYIVRVDADDWVNPQFLNLLYHHLNLNMELDAVACDYQIVNNQQKILSYENCEKKPIGCGIMFKYSNLIEIGLYDKKFLAREEEELIHRFKKKYKVTRIPVPLYRYRKHENNLTKKKIL